MPPNVRLNRVFCLEESVWGDESLTDRASVLPTLELLHRSQQIERFVHRHVLGDRDFENYLSWRAEPKLRTYGTIYLAFHGRPEGLCVGAAEPYSLDQLAAMVGSLPGGVVHLGSCSILQDNEEDASRFLKSTGARLISGYESDVAWLDSAALDTAWLGYIATYARLGDAERWFRQRYRSLIDHLRWKAIRAM